MDTKREMRNVSGGRIGSIKSSLIIPGKKIVIPNRIMPKELERRIDPWTFPMDAKWLQHVPQNATQKEIKDLFLDARAKGRLHAFTCMAIDISYNEKTGKLRYKKGWFPETGHSYDWWVNMLANFAPHRNSRPMTKTEYACKCLFLIWKLVEECKLRIDEAWHAVCNRSNKFIANKPAPCQDTFISDEYNFARRSNLPYYKDGLFATGRTTGICGFHDLGGVYKLLAKDPWEKPEGNNVYDVLYYVASNSIDSIELIPSAIGTIVPANWLDKLDRYCVGLPAFD